MNKAVERLVQLNIAQIHLDLGTQPRATLNHEWVAELTEIVKKEAEPGARELPPPIVFWDGSRYIMASGFHRTAARKAAKQKVMTCKVRDGDLRDAILFAASTNSDHGLQRTPADCRHVARILLLDPEWGKWSNKEISRWCKIKPHYVGEERERIKEQRRLEREKEEAKKAAEEEKKKPAVSSVASSSQETPKKEEENVKTSMPSGKDVPKTEEPKPPPNDGSTVKFIRGGKTIEMNTTNVGKGPRTYKVKPVYVEKETSELAKLHTQLKRSIPKAVKQAIRAGWSFEKFVEECRKAWEEIPVVGK